MSRAAITLKVISESLGGTISTWSQKLNGKYPITLDEAKALKKLLNSDLPLEVLFEKFAEAS
jgi:hypothetical protein